MADAQNTKEYLTQEKYDELQGELNSLKTVRRKEIAESLEYAKSLGDLSENAEYHEARDEQAKVEDRILRIESILKNAVIVSHHDAGGIIEMGSEVKVTKKGEQTAREYTIVGSEEVDTTKGKISYSSPLGQALLGKKKGDSVSINTPSGVAEYLIVSVD